MNRTARALEAVAVPFILAAILVPDEQQPAAPITPPVMTAPAGSGAVEQKSHGTKPPAAVVESFDGLGVGFDGPQGAPTVRNPSDNSLAVGPNHIVQTVNSRMAIFTKTGKQFDTTGKALWGSPRPSSASSSIT